MPINLARYVEWKEGEATLWLPEDVATERRRLRRMSELL